MAFWSGETIKARLPTLIDKPDVDCIDGAAYMLKVGPEYYVSATELDPDRNTRTMKTLSADECFAIPGGQFALVLTEEAVTVPITALGFFSIRSRAKWKGLINVSGFHIDPGFCGRLTIAVYNAGSFPIHFRRGEPEFLIWLADLDPEASVKYSKHANTRVTKIDASVLNQAPGKTQSLQSLAARIDRVNDELGKRIDALEQFKSIAKWIVAAVVGALIGLAVKSWYDAYAHTTAPQSPPAVSTPQAPPAPSQAPAKQ
jgi:dCTP deaminase